MTSRNLRLFKFFFALLRMNPRHLLQRAPLLLGALILAPAIVFAAGNERIQSFSQAKKILEREIYADHRVTLYCGAKFDERKRVELPAGFMTPKHAARAERVEWEHVVPAENFGRAFSEWREGAPACVDSRGRAYKGRRCAEKASAEFRRMESDLYNLYPAIGAVNAMRSNYRYALLPDVPPTFGSCAMKVARRRAEPPEEARGTIARSVLYMAASYPAYRLNDRDRKLFEAWNAAYPPDAWECRRAERIRRVQGNANDFAVEACRRAGFAP